jgi:hypothetical protein
MHGRAVKQSDVPGFEKKLARNRGSWGIMQKTGKQFLFISLILCVPVIVFLVWLNGQHNFTGPLKIHNAVLCEELNENNLPSTPAERFEWGTRQVCLRFVYSAPRTGSQVRIQWVYESRVIFQEQLTISDKKGVKAFYLLREDGTPLPMGEYCVVVESDGREALRRCFSITR